MRSHSERADTTGRTILLGNVFLVFGGLVGVVAWLWLRILEGAGC